MRGRIFAVLPSALALLVGATIAIAALIRPMFGFFLPDSVSFDFGNHLALVGGALDTWRTTHAVPISSDALVPGVEYPYFLFGNAGFYVIASFMSFVLQAPANFGAASTLCLGLVCGQLGTFLLARSFGLNRGYSVGLGFLYATGPYLCINLLVRAAFPEFLAWEMLPLLCVMGRRAMQPGAGILSLAGLGVLLALPIYLHKLVGPHIILFELILLLVNARRSLGWVVRLLVLGLSLPFVSVFAWLPILRLDRDQIVTLKLGSMGEIQVINDSPINYFWPWAQDSLPAALREAQYGDRFALQIGLLATLGVLYGAWWWLFKSRFRPRYRELYVGVLGGVIYSALVLDIGGVTGQLPFPLNTIQFSYRLLGLASFSGLLALVASLGEAASHHGASKSRWLEYLGAGVVAMIITLSVATYWRPPPLTTIPLASIKPSELVDLSALYPRSMKSLFDTSGAMATDGSLSTRPFPIHLRGVIEHTVPGGTGLVPPASREPTPRTIYLRGQPTAADFAVPDASVLVRVYALQSSADPCATDTELPKDRTDTITALLALCDDRQVPGAKRPVALSGGAWIPTLMAERMLTAPGSLEMRIAIPDDVFFMAVECGRRIGSGTAPPVAGGPTPSCLNVHYLGPANQLDNTLQIPRSIPPTGLTRGPFGQLTIRLTNEAPGDYLLPTFDYPFVKIKDESGADVPAYQFDSRPVIRFDGIAQTYSISYDLRRELAIVAAWVCGILVLLAIWLYRRARWRGFKLPR